MKKCTKCKETQPLTEFYKEKSMADGHQNQCKACRKEYQKAHYGANRKQILEKQKAYNAAHREQHRESSAKWNGKNPLKRKAKDAVNYAIRDGRMTKPVLCECCGSKGKLHGHHVNYSKPLDVQWLCVPCHNQWHVKYGEGLTGTAA
ncbi:MAG: hypothetical protein GY743_19145 [Planctomycetaceae bacterium]|nr:hypothetical protein [Planctomycetaceae bacterium]